MKRTIPHEILRLQAERMMKRLKVRDVSRLSGVGYSDTSRILNGWLTHPQKVAKIRRAIQQTKGVTA